MYVVLSIQFQISGIYKLFHLPLQCVHACQDRYVDYVPIHIIYSYLYV